MSGSQETVSKYWLLLVLILMLVLLLVNKLNYFVNYIKMLGTLFLLLLLIVIKFS